MDATERVLMIAVRSSDHLVQSGQLEAAATILENYLNAHAARPGVLQRLGRIRLKMGQPQEAATLLEKALTLTRESRVPDAKDLSESPTDSGGSNKEVAA